MILPFAIQLDKSILKAAIYVSFLSAGGMFLINLILFLLEGKLLVLLKNWNVFKVLISQFEIISIFLIPIFIGSFIRPLSRRKKDLIIQGGVVLLISSFIYFTIVTYLPSLDIYPHDDRNLNTNLLLLGSFIAINLAIYLPAIFKNECNP